MKRKTTFNRSAATLARARTPLALALVAALGITPLAASAATISVTSPGDTNPSSTGTCTLRQAIVSMNNASVAGSSCIATGSFGSDDTITFDPAVFPANGSGTITLSGSQLDISASDLSIDASANSNVTIDAAQASRILRSASHGALSLSHLTLRNGSMVQSYYDDLVPCGTLCASDQGLHLDSATVTDSSTEDSVGIYAYDGHATISNSHVSGHLASGDSGTMYAGNYNYVGGAIYARNDVYLSDSTLSDNSANYGGGIFSIDGNLTLTNSTLSGNSANVGGGIRSKGRNLTLINSTLSGNSANYGGGIYSTNGNLTLTSSTLSGNSAVEKSYSYDGGNGGGIWLKYGTITATGSTLSGNSADHNGGGIEAYSSTVTLDSSTLSDNSANYRGGGIYSTDGDLTVTNSTLSGNSATRSGGGVYTRFGNVTLNNSTLSGNSAHFGGGLSSTGDTLTVVNSTLSGNLAARGAGIYAGYGSFALINTTVSGNTSTGRGGGLRLVYTSSATASNSIVAGNTQASGSDIDGDTLSGNNNLLGTDPMLAPLSDSGGLTQTMLPLAGSPAIDAGLCHDANAATPDKIPVTDQRGVARPQGSGCDIGAVEHIATMQLRGLGRNGQQTPTGAAFAWPLVVQSLDGGGNAVAGITPEVNVPASGASATCASEPTDVTGVARIVCMANAVAGTYVVHISTPFGPNAPPLQVTYTLTNLPNDRIFGSGFEGSALPTAGVSP